MKKIACFAVLVAFWAGAVSAAEITMGFAPVPPYVMEASDGSLSGLEYEIIKEALAARGHTLRPQLFPLARVIETVRQGNTQAGARILEAHDTGRHLSDVYLVFNNVAVGLRNRNLDVSSISDLGNLRMVSFQRATIVLGSDFASAARNSPGYSEVADQRVQIRMLFGDRVDVAVGESRILQHFIHDPETGVDTGVATEEFAVFPETPYRVAFVNEQHMRDFNEGLAEIRANGRYDAIIRKYAPR
ncbi:amino acid ABC transporter substrate-binding protein, PAAT family [Alkalispirochaeta americana]|uniref:Amino acid ABC transporter substrate-binding protein, PAAT family n=1 Tax=Alkalispirochaeta americana TaxID=159291 RepID=A0A1N6N5V8_9SPIO|nr:transporter substrate-binding domain-containing protein [Alkalispirochaeta americana]SIP87458.1 amino acid ABC transporter substrate-binding protein, PAAT family [Alkalispirochaeta americana]